MGSHELSLPSLPVELVSHILAKVKSRETLKNATLCSKAFHDIAIPHLYDCVNIHADVNNDDELHAIIRKSTIHFLRNPALAAHVRHFSIRPAFEDDLLNYQNPPKQSLDEILAASTDLEDEIKEAIKEASHSDEEHAKWLEDNKCDDALLALLLPLFTKVETLDIEEPISPQYVDRMLQRAGRKEKPFDKKPAFKRLHSFTWVHNDNTCGGSFASGPFMFPSVTSMYFHRMASSDEDDEPESGLKEIEYGASSCTHLELADCRLNDADTRILLAIPKELKSFIYEFGWGHLAYCNISFQTLRTALEQHKDSLEDLAIDFGFDGIEWIEPDVTLPMKSFSEFSKLRKIRIAPDFVFGVTTAEQEASPTETLGRRYERLLDFLPPTIEYLNISHGNDFKISMDGTSHEMPDKISTLYKAIEHIFLNKETIPELKKIVLDTSLSRIKEDGDRLTELLKLADSIGLELVIQNNWGDKKWGMYGERVERKWGFDEDIVWQDCSSGCHARPIFEVFELQR